MCAARTATLIQKLFYFVLVPGVFLLGFVRDWKIAFTILTFALCAFYGAVILFRLLGVAIALLRSSEHRVSQEEIDALRDEDLPMYTVLVPMYKEPEVAQKIARTVTSLNYPLDKLDIKLLLEEDDAPTRAKIDEVAGSLPPCVEVMICPAVPKGQPKTKPRACNWGLEKARGKYLVIFDAEDHPEADQLKKAVIAFKRLEAAGKTWVACLQAKLNYFNAHQNHLTRFFTLEYTNWFDLFLPGLHAVRTPIPLGGTSNHFKTDVLRDLGGWDPFNVTEDCDLGIRLARRGHSTEVLDSTTWEEANSQVRNWIRQRSRWIKGYFQTHLVHSRDSYLPLFVLAGLFALLYAMVPRGFESWGPKYQGICVALGSLSLVCGLFVMGRRAARRIRGNSEGHLGPYNSFTFRLTVGGLSLMLLLNMVFWVMTLTYLGRREIAAALPNSAARFKIGDSTLRETLETWEIYHTRVTDPERYPDVTFWNTLGLFAKGKLSWSKGSDGQSVVERIGAIDDWSLISQLFFPVELMLFAANFIFILLGLLSCHKRKLWELFPYALLVPFYWVLISIAALKGFFQLFTNPWYWERTQHGLTHQSPPEIPSAGPPAGTHPTMEVPA